MESNLSKQDIEIMLTGINISSHDIKILLLGEGAIRDFVEVSDVITKKIMEITGKTYPEAGKLLQEIQDKCC